MTTNVGSLNAPSSVRRWQIDDVTLTYVVDGVMSMVPSAFLPDIPAAYWEAHPDEVDDEGHVVMSTGGLLVQRGEHRLLIDTGFGPAQLESPFGRVDCGAFLQTLVTLGVAPADIDVVALTHLHPDHTGWLFTDEQTPVFPNAAYTLAAAEWAPFAAGEDADSASVQQVVSGLRRHPWRRVVTDGEEIAPGVTAVVTPGHSSGHTSYVVTSEHSRRIVAFGDAFHAPAQLANPHWGSAPDVDPAAVPAARGRIRAELLEPDTYGFAIHFGDQPFGRVPTADDAPGWEPVPTDVVAPPPDPPPADQPGGR